MNEHASNLASPESRVAGRYVLHELLGRGGMASVYRATDQTTGQALALKQLTVPPGTPERAVVEALFEREFHTLAQLRHPRVIEVYDYGVDADSGAFYTMELLDGGDLRDRAPLPWRECCRIAFDVCSSLALLHSRWLIHRDVTPRNIRCTRDGKAKLIDFGALAPMGPSEARLVGTPAFTPPESVYHQALDGRADLYSLGVTLYFALTRTVPYQARTFADVAQSWKAKVTPPSKHVADIPTELDDLVLSLINLDSALRPQGAFDVMQQLAALAGIESSESEAVSRAYLTTPALVGREQVLAALRAKLSKRGEGQSAPLMLSGVTGVGRSRVLDACLLDAKVLGFTVLRATARGSLEPFAVAHALLQHLLEALPNVGLDQICPQLFATNPWVTANDTGLEDVAPVRVELKRLADVGLGADQLQDAVCRALSTISRRHPLVLAVDDVHRLDQASGAVLATLSDNERWGNMFIVMTMDSSESRSEAQHVLARRCEQWTLEPLTRDQTLALFGSLFGDVANLQMLADEVYSVALGNPRQCLDMAQHLVDKGLVRYGAGSWALPGQLSVGDLPESAEAAMRERIAQLSPRARLLAEAHALAFFEVFSRRDYVGLAPDESSADIDQAIFELVEARALLRDDQAYTFSNQLWCAAFKAGLDASEAASRHRALAVLYEGRSTFAVIYHLFCGGMNEQGLDALLLNEADWDKGFNHQLAQEQNVGKMIWCAGVAADVAEQLGRSKRQVSQLQRWYVAGIATTESKLFRKASARWLEQIKRDSGFALWDGDPDTANPGERLTRALQTAHQRYLDTPDVERVYSVPEALRLLAEYVVLSIAVGARSNDSALVATLPPLLEPFIALSPALDVIWRNAVATYRSHCECRYAEAYAIWVEVLEKLATMTNEIQHLEPIRGAVTFAVGIMEAQFGLASAANHAARLDHDPYQKITAVQLRKIVRLEQGDWHGADRLRRQAEVLSLQVRTAPMFKTLLTVEASAYAKARDLAGLQDVIAQMRPLTAEYPGWIPVLREAEARFNLVRGDYAAAEQGFEQCLGLTEPGADGFSSNRSVWINCQAGLAETLLSTGRLEQARERAREAVAYCAQHGIEGQAIDLVRVLAMVEAKLGDPRAAERLDALIAKQVALGVTGLRLGLSYEARAQIAIWSGDGAAFERYSALTAREYRYGLGCPLGVRYERLINEAKRHGFSGSARLGDYETAIETALTLADDVQTKLERIMTDVDSDDERAARALRVMCVAWRARAGHLFAQGPDGVQRRASIEPLDSAASDSLNEQVQQFLTLELERAASASDMETMPESEATQMSTVQVAGATYELVLLTCFDGAKRRVAGVAALTPATGPREAEHTQIVPAVARELLGVRGAPARAAGARPYA